MEKYIQNWGAINSKTASEEPLFEDLENKPYIQKIYTRCTCEGKYLENWGEISHKLLQKNHSLEFQKSSILFKNVSQGDASMPLRNISKTASKEPQFGDAENQQNVKKCIPGSCLQAGEKYHISKTASKEAVWRSREPVIFKKVSNGYIWGELSPKLGRNIIKTAPK